MKLLNEPQKTREAHGYKPLVINLLIIPHTLGILPTNISYCILFEDINETQVNTRVG